MSKLIVLAAAGLGLTLGTVALNVSSVSADTPVATSGTYDQSANKDKGKKKTRPKGSSHGSYSGE
jgi:hypothetical protein